MDNHIAEIVCALAGRDKGKYFLVIAQEENFLYLCDGKGRKVGSPKKKKIKHVSLTGIHNEFVESKLAQGGKVTNKEVRYALSDYLTALANE